MANNDGGIEELKQKLFSRTQTTTERERRPLHEKGYAVGETWQHTNEKEKTDTFQVFAQHARNAQKSTATQSAKLVRTIFIGSVGFFLLSIVVAGFMIVTGGNSVSADNIDIAVAGPLAVAGGSELTLQIEITNRNSVPIKLADLLVEYPEGTRSASDMAIDLPRFRETVGTIEPGGKAKTTVKALLFGDEDAAKSILITVEYRVDGSNAIFYKERPYEVVLSSAPLALVVTTVNEISVGQPVVMNIALASNATEPIHDVIVRAEYPFGFELSKATPKPSFDNFLWRIGDLEPGAKREIEITGVLVGETNDERIFRFSAGIAKADAPREIAAVFDSTEVPISIQAPFVGVVVAANGDSSTKPTVAKRGDTVRVDIEWINNLPTPIYDLEITAKINGNALDRTKVKTNGFYRSIDDTIIWNNETTENFQEIGARERGSVQFEFSSIPLATDSALPKPKLTVDVSVAAKRLLENNVPEKLLGTGKKTIVVGTSAELVAEVQYATGKFTNSGSVPPRVNQETTYTIHWTLANSTSDIKDGSVRARLPWYVTWMDQVETTAGTIKYNPVGGEIVWDVGTIPARAGFEKAPVEGWFQVAFTPSSSQFDESPVLVQNPRFSGTDTFTQATIESTHIEQTTTISNEPQFGQQSGKVAQ